MMTRIQCVLLLTCILLCGCDPQLSVEKKFKLEPGHIKSVVLDPISSEQVVTVNATGDDLFHAHVYLTGDDESVDTDLAKGNEPAKALGGAREKKTHSFQATIPANKEAQVRLEAAVGSEVNVTITVSN